MILVVDNYDSFTYNLVQLLALLGAEVRVERNDDVTPAQVLAMEPNGVVISPGPGTPDVAGNSEPIIAAAADAGDPGTRRVPRPSGDRGGVRRARSSARREAVHGKTSTVRHTGEGLMAGMPAEFTATRYHSLIVDRVVAARPAWTSPRRRPTASSWRCSTSTKPVFGVQFHPESVLTPEGVIVARNFLELSPARSSPRSPPARAAALPIAVGRAGHGARRHRRRDLGRRSDRGAGRAR